MASEYKTCSNKECRQVNPLPVSSFYARKGSKDGRMGVCGRCHLERGQKWALNNPIKIQAINTRANIKRQPYRSHKKKYCEKCNFIGQDSCQLHVDHIDGNHSNNSIENLQTLCANCHALKSKLNKDVGRKKNGSPTNPN